MRPFGRLRCRLTEWRAGRRRNSQTPTALNTGPRRLGLASASRLKRRLTRLAVYLKKYAIGRKVARLCLSIRCPHGPAALVLKISGGLNGTKWPSIFNGASRIRKGF